jgi:hypothetical protein
LKVKDGEMRYRNFKSEKFAVAGVIEALLLIALVAIILSIIQLNYVPQIMEQKESEHMDEVANQFSYLKSVIDLQIMTEKDVPISSPVTLGSLELPYFVSARSFGQIDIIDETTAIDNDKNLTIISSTPNVPDVVNLTSIRYTAYNTYYLQGGDLIYAIEGGGIFLKQYDGGTVLVKPALSAKLESDIVTINYTLPLFKSIPGKKAVGGYKDAFIRTNYTRTRETYIYENVEFINISTDYLEEWNQTLINNDSGVLWEYYDDSVIPRRINVEFDDMINPNYIVISPGTKDIKLELTLVEIGVQTGPGIVYKN